MTHIYSTASGTALHTLTWDVKIDIDAGYDREILDLQVTTPELGWASILESIVEFIAPNNIGWIWWEHRTVERSIADDEFWVA